MLTNFERKVRQILLNDRTLGRVINMMDLELRTGHTANEIKKAVEKLKHTRKMDGGLLP